LHGAAGNPTAIGARVTLELADGARQTAEVAAGPGATTPSPAGCFFGYPSANPPRHLRVRWPDGTASRHEVTPAATVLTVAKPAN